jgi:hypothetical protein
MRYVAGSASVMATRTSEPPPFLNACVSTPVTTPVRSLMAPSEKVTSASEMSRMRRLPPSSSRAE